MAIELHVLSETSYPGSCSVSVQKPEAVLYKTISLLYLPSLQFSFPRVSLFNSLSSTDQKIQTIALKEGPMKLRKVSGGGEIGISADWDGNGGGGVSGYIKGEMYDDHGNYLKGEAKQNNDGSGSASISAGHQED